MNSGLDGRGGSCASLDRLAGLARQSLPSRRCEPIVLGAAAERRQSLWNVCRTGSSSAAGRDAWARVMVSVADTIGSWCRLSTPVGLASDDSALRASPRPAEEDVRL